MRATGIIRKIDELGRVVLPIELRRNLGIDIKDTLSICVDGNAIILTKYIPQCFFCKSSQDVKNVNGKIICIECKVNLKNL